MKSFQKTFHGESGARTHALREHTSFDWKELNIVPTDLNDSFFTIESKKIILRSLFLIYDIIM